MSSGPLPLIQQVYGFIEHLAYHYSSLVICTRTRALNNSILDKDLSCVMTIKDHLLAWVSELSYRSSHPITLIDLLQDTFYQCSFDLTSPPAHIWFSYDLHQTSLTYVIYNPSQELKQNIFACAGRRTANLLLRPLAVDTFIAEDSMNKLGAAAAALRLMLLPYVRFSVCTYPIICHLKQLLAIGKELQHNHDRDRICDGEFACFIAKTEYHKRKSG